MSNTVYIPNDFLIISKDSVLEFASTVWHNFGSIFSVSLYIFVAIISVFGVVEIVRYLSN